MFTLVAFTSSSFATTSDIKVKENKVEQNLVTLTNEHYVMATTCYDVFASAYNAWIALGHTAREAHTRATRTLNACLNVLTVAQP